MRIARATQHPALQLFVTQRSLQSAGLADFPLSPDQAKHVLRRYSQLCVQSRRDLVEAALRKARAHAQADKGGFLFVKVSCDRLSRCSLHCRCCALTFDTAAALGAHLAKIHAQAAPAAYGFGTACESCRKQFWSTARLREHLRRAAGVQGFTLKQTGRLAKPRRPLRVGRLRRWSSLRPMVGSAKF